MPSTITPPAGTPTQVAHPWRAVLRFVVAWVLGGLLAWLARTTGLDLTQFSDAMADSLTGGIALLGAGFVQWLLTRPGVESWLRRYVPVLATGVHKEAPRGPDGVYQVTDLED